MKITNKELIEMSINWFNDIKENSKRLTSGNVSHNARQIEGFALHCAEFLEKYKEIERHE